MKTKMTTKIGKILVSWYEQTPDNKIVSQTRVYNNWKKALKFAESLPERGVTEGIFKLTVNFAHEDAVDDRQLSMDI